ncbi:hypothetical protein GGS26DRAFT_428674 [Hypomontagnella submonticulosa]|nr:hypothetical protein GGS26DRAFT_428674 [Hypomontagnella submonticulosa]
MKPSHVLSLAYLHLLPAVLAGKKDDSGSGCCKFTITSSGPVACPAGQLPDGQIRLNGSYPETTFCLGKDGGLTDDHGRGCTVTEAPITQIQCDENKAPLTGFSISPDNALLYKGSSSFFACPATDSEYNIYVAPNFGQAKCVPITLKASGGCGTQPPTSTCPAPPPPTTVYQTSVETDVSTKWQTQVLTQTETETTTLKQTELVTQIASSTVTSTFTQTSTITTTCTVTESVAQTVSEVHTSVQVITSTLPCTSVSSTTGWNSTTTSTTSSSSAGCHKCTAGSSNTSKDTGTGAYPTGGTQTDITIQPTITSEANGRKRRNWGF